MNKNNDLQIFNFQDGNEVRTSIKDNDSIWFCLNDVCKVLEINNVADVKSRLDEGGIVSIDVTSENTHNSKFARKTQ
jgi:prophage antirepressor-like protein